MGAGYSVRLRVRAKAAVLGLAGFVGIGALAIWFVLNPPELVILRGNTIIPRLVRGATIIASGYETLRWIVVIIRRSSGLVVDSTGITESFASIRTRSYPWSNVSAVDARGEFVHLSLHTRYFPLKFKPSVFGGFEDEPWSAEEMARRILEFHPNHVG